MDSTAYKPDQNVDEWQERKRLGAFYTPSKLSDILCTWAIQSPRDEILEPSFGGCGFLESATAVLTTLGAEAPEKQLFGCDIDPKAFGHLSSNFNQLVDLENFKKVDFLTFEGDIGWQGRFDAVVGNPPYLSYHHIKEKTQEASAKLLEQINFDIPHKSSTWAYFVALSLRFLKPGGRVAWVLPGSFLKTNYAAPLRRMLARHFNNIRAFQIHERLFLYEGTDEQTIVVLGDGYRRDVISGSLDDITLTRCKLVSELVDAIAKWNDNSLASSDLCGNAVASALPLATQEALEVLSSHTAHKTLGDLGYARIGLVTGANSFFLLSPTFAKSKGLSTNDLHHTLGKFIDAPGMAYTKADTRTNETRDRRCLLVHAETLDAANPHIRAYLDEFPEEKKKTNSTFKKRKSWTRTDDGNPPDAFFPVMHHLGPRLVLNHTGVNCTNTVHRVYFHDRLPAHRKKLVAISMLSTFSQLSAEIVGRQYGSGVLKHEPREAEKIQLILPTHKRASTINKCFSKIDYLLRAGDVLKARQCADEFVLKPIFKNNYEIHLGLLTAGLEQTRERRHPGDRSKKKRPKLG